MITLRSSRRVTRQPVKTEVNSIDAQALTSEEAAIPGKNIRPFSCTPRSKVFRNEVSNSEPTANSLSL